MRRFFVLSVVVLLVIALLWRAIPGTGETGELREPAAQVHPTSSVRAPEFLSGSPLAAAETAQLPREIGVPATTAVERRVTIRAVTVDGRALAGVNIFAGTTERGPPEQSDTTWQGRTDDAGLLSAALVGGRSWVIWGAATRDPRSGVALKCARRRLADGPAADGERIELRYEPGCEEVFATRVVRAQDLAPLASAALNRLDARLDVGGPQPRKGTQAMDGPEAALAIADAEGRLELCTSVVNAGLVRLGAAGFSPCVFGIEPSATPHLEVRLEHAARLQVRVLDLESTEAPCAIVVETEAWELLPRGWEPTLGRRGKVGWVTHVDAGGQATLADLPAFAPLTLEVTRLGRVLHELPDALVFEPGEERRLEIDLRAGIELEVRLLDQDGRPVPGAQLDLTRDDLASGTAAEEVIVAFTDPPVVQRSDLTDDDGRARFEALASGTWWVAVSASRSPWDPVEEQALAPLARRVWLTPGSERHELTLRTCRGLYIDGRLETPGDPGDVILLAHSLDGGGGLTGQSDDAGHFAIGPVGDGRYRIETFARNLAPIVPRIVRAADEALLLRLEPGAALRGRVLDAATRAGVRCEFVISSPDSGRDEVLGSSDEQGNVGTDGLAPGEYVLSAFSADGRVACSERLRAATGSAPAGFELLLPARAACAELRITLDAPAASGRLVARQGVRVVSACFVDGPGTRVLPAPPGPTDVELRVGSEAVWRAAVEAQAGRLTDLRAVLPR